MISTSSTIRHQKRSGSAQGNHHRSSQRGMRAGQDARAAGRNITNTSPGAARRTIQTPRGVSLQSFCLSDVHVGLQASPDSEEDDCADKTCHDLRSLVIVDGRIVIRRFQCFNELVDEGDEEASSDAWCWHLDVTPNHLHETHLTIHFPSLHQISVFFPDDGFERIKHCPCGRSASKKRGFAQTECSVSPCMELGDSGGEEEMEGDDGQPSHEGGRERQRKRRRGRR